MIKFNVSNFNQRMYKQRMSFAFDFDPNFHETQLVITSLLLLFHIGTHNFFSGEIKLFEKCVELCL